MHPALALSLSCALACLLPLPASGTVFNPDSLADDVDAVPGDGVCAAPGAGECTLRAAVMEANALPGADSISLNPLVYTLSRVGAGEQGGDLDVTDDLVIGSPGAVIDGGGIDRVLDVSGADHLTLSGLTLRNGRPPSLDADGGCIRAQQVGYLRLVEVELTDCQTPGHGGGLVYSSNSVFDEVRVERSWIHVNVASTGGGIHVTGSARLIVQESTISHNQSTHEGGGIYSQGDLTAGNTTIAWNSAELHGGGLYALGHIDLSNVTLVDNWCDIDADENGEGCGLWVNTATNNVVRNTIIADNLNWNLSVPVVQQDNCYSGIYDLISDGYNLVGAPGDCLGLSAANHDLVGDPELGPLADHGGVTPTMVPAAGSPVLDAGNPAGCVWNDDAYGPTPVVPLMTDQRNVSRALAADATGAPVCDIGAVEYIGPLFLDGFESGGLEAWSASMP